MTRRKAREIVRIFRELTPAEEQRLKRFRQQIEQELPEIMAKGRQILSAHKLSQQVIVQLRQERERQGLSLADIKDRTGIGREAISKLENDPSPNPTVRTLVRYASALGMELQLNLVPEKQQIAGHESRTLAGKTR